MEDFITIVSGLPRSGTSLMMQMLVAGGIEAVTDGERKRDEDNPKGYYELEKIKQLKKDSSWLGEARGKCLKCIHTLLPDLLPEYCYKVIFMERDLQEILASQQKMLGRSGKKGSALAPEKLAAIFAVQINKTKIWLQEQKNFNVLYIEYGKLIANPGLVMEINAFLGNILDCESMKKTIDPELYRNKK